MYKVLIIEDDGLIYSEIEKGLDNEFEVCRATSFAAALGQWKKEEEAFDCIVLDLQINPLGLNLSENDKYTPFIGMAVLDAFTNGKSNENKIQLRKKVIIYSGYAQSLRADTKSFNLSNLEIIHKSGDSIKKVIKCIKCICSKS